MTLSPSEDRRVQGLNGPPYELNLICAVPGCDESYLLERHHLWRRSALGGDKWWVRTHDGVLHGNCVNLCHDHHGMVTDNVARISYKGGDFFWQDPLTPKMILLWQPPTSLPKDDVDDREDADGEQKKDDPDLLLVEHLGAHHVLSPHHEPDVCPTCLRKLPQPRSENFEEKKVRKTWSVAVPMDAWENGAETIDVLLRESHVELNKLGLPYGEGRTVKYYILTAALGMFVTHAESLMSDG
jgi:hypothetical protein